ncbi:unnamed protein product [Strongylus vulgaris]|uniref:Uncharacterized protein n=1 Tax=Strongylus vulgaris TaxID=40348 RepID=A0A3P7L6E6_STRVU|nr:unnamed protein product [Strongylus vulgaris]
MLRGVRTASDSHVERYEIVQDRWICRELRSHLDVITCREFTTAFAVTTTGRPRYEPTEEGEERQLTGYPAYRNNINDVLLLAMSRSQCADQHTASSRKMPRPQSPAECVGLFFFVYIACYSMYLFCAHYRVWKIIKMALLIAVISSNALNVRTYHGPGKPPGSPLREQGARLTRG